MTGSAAYCTGSNDCTRSTHGQPLGVLDVFYDDLRRYGNAKAAARARAEAAARGKDLDKATAAAQPSASDQRLSANPGPRRPRDPVRGARHGGPVGLDPVQPPPVP
jgi:hypothetical protein